MTTKIIENLDTGQMCEDDLKMRLIKMGVRSYRVNTWYDIEIGKTDGETVCIEVKSTSFLMNNGGGKRKYGCFDLGDKGNISRRKRLRVFYAFYVTMGSEQEFLGVVNATTLPEKRYLSLSYVMSFCNPHSLEVFIRRLRNKGGLEE